MLSLALCSTVFPVTLCGHHSFTTYFSFLLAHSHLQVARRSTYHPHLQPWEGIREAKTLAQDAQGACRGQARPGLPGPGTPSARLGEGTQDGFLSEECELLLGEEILQAWMKQLKSDASFTQFQISDKVSFLEPGPT